MKAMSIFKLIINVALLIFAVVYIFVEGDYQLGFILLLFVDNYITHEKLDKLETLINKK